MPPFAIRSILHPTDFSVGSEIAFIHALSIAVACRARLAVLHADRREPSSYWGDFPAVRRTLERWGMLPEGGGQEAVFDRLGVAVTKIGARDAHPVEAVARHVEGHQVDLIVLATRGVDGLPRWLGRPVAESVLERTRIATLFLAPASRGFVAQADGGIRLGRVLVPVDTEPSPTRAFETLDALLETAKVPAGRIEVLHVGSPASAPAIVETRADGRFGKARTRAGEPVEVILEEASDHDLVVMATSGTRGLLDVMRGTTTQRVLRRAPCPVLAVPED